MNHEFYIVVLSLDELTFPFDCVGHIKGTDVFEVATS